MPKPLFVCISRIVMPASSYGHKAKFQIFGLVVLADVLPDGLPDDGAEWTSLTLRQSPHVAV